MQLISALLTVTGALGLAFLYRDIRLTHPRRKPDALPHSILPVNRHLRSSHPHNQAKVNLRRGKRRRCRTCNYLSVTLDWARANPAEQALWLGSIAPHGALNAQAIQVRVRHQGRAAGVHVTPHILRHTCATHLVSNGANIVAVQRLLGHASLATTEIYTRITLSEIKTAYHQAHPRSRYP